MNTLVIDTNIKKLRQDKKYNSSNKLQVSNVNDLNIGAKIKKLRQGKKLTLQTVADKIGFSPALISQIENNNVSPPIATLSKIASFFEVKIGMFFVEDENENRFEVVHANERKPITKTFTPVDNACGYSCESLSFRMHNKKMEPFLLTVNESSLEEATYSHTGEKFLFITKGNVELILDNKHILLSQGDSIYFDSTIKHRLVSKDNNVEVLTVIAR